MRFRPVVITELLGPQAAAPGKRAAAAASLRHMFGREDKSKDAATRTEGVHRASMETDEAQCRSALNWRFVRRLRLKRSHSGHDGADCARGPRPGVNGHEWYGW